MKKDVIQRLSWHTITLEARGACTPNTWENNEAQANSTVSLDPPQLSSCYFDLSDLMWLLDATQAADVIKVNKFVVRKNTPLIESTSQIICDWSASQPEEL